MDVEYDDNAGKKLTPYARFKLQRDGIYPKTTIAFTDRICEKCKNMIYSGTFKCQTCANACGRRTYYKDVDATRITLAAKAARYRADDPEYYREKATRFSAKFRKDNPGYHARWQAKARLDPDYAAASIAASKVSAKKKPELQLLQTQKKRARKKSAPGRVVSGPEWLAIVTLCGNRCCICAVSGEEVPLEVDHIIPLTRGGSHDVDNVQPLCKPCNATKHKRMPKVLNFQPWARKRVQAAIDAHKKPKLF
jgi:5-methylcytosine-specific restriction endonuclease McrA